MKDYVNYILFIAVLIFALIKQIPVIISGIKNKNYSQVKASLFFLSLGIAIALFCIWLPNILFD